MGMKIKLDFSKTEVKAPVCWIKHILHDSIVLTDKEELAFEFNNTREIGTAIHGLKYMHPELKIAAKPVLRIVQ
jgi:hypothetical protein